MVFLGADSIITSIIMEDCWSSFRCLSEILDREIIDGNQESTIRENVIQIYIWRLGFYFKIMSSKHVEWHFLKVNLALKQ